VAGAPAVSESRDNRGDLKRKLLAHLREYWIDYALPLSLFALMVYGIVTLATYEP
jgi:hypothetical protein